MKLIWIALLGLAVSSVAASPTKTRRMCMEFGKRIDLSQLLPDDDNSGETEDIDNNEIDEVIDPEQAYNETQQRTSCSSPFEYCYAAFGIAKDGQIAIKSQGCWEHLRGCNQSACIGHKEQHSVVFCCCNSDLCNNNLTNLTPQTSPVAVPPELPSDDKSMFNRPMVWVSFTSTGIMLIIIAAVFLASCRTKTKSEPPEASPLAPSGPGYSSNLYNVDNLKPICIIGEGKYGTVWKGMVNEQPVAVKIFGSNKKQYYHNEREIYNQPFMDTCPALLTYFGCDERLNSDNKMEYLLVLSLAPLGCLQDYLRENSTPYQVFCKMTTSISRGLSHLHTKIQKGDMIKMCICHRDLNSRNILVKSDLSCCICDYGFAMKLAGSRYDHQGEMILAETKSIYEVGTLRYMAPEILEGAVNLRDCETALKQIDVYSLGLVLWELCMRCHDFYPPEMITPTYKAPYEAEIGVHPSFDQMRSLVLQHKARPLFPPTWGGGPSAVVVKEICEDCWDPDAEARLTSLCVEERLMEISSLKPRSHCVHVSSSTPLSTNNFISTAPPSTISSISPMRDATIPPNQIVAHAEYTCDTTLSSPSSGDSARVVPIKNREMFAQQIQPFQGRNLCLERNLVQIHQQDLPRDDKTIIKSQLANGNLNINSSNNDHFYNMEYEVLVEELLNKNMAPPSCTSSPAIMSQHHYTEILPKRNNGAEKKPHRWSGVRDMIQRKFLKKNQHQNITKSLDGQQRVTSPMNKNIHMNMMDSHQHLLKPNNIQRPRHLDISPIVVDRNSKNQTFKTPPNDCTNETFAIVRESSKIVTSKSATLNSSIDEVNRLKRQRSLEVFKDVFGPAKGSVERLRDVHQRIKTPGDVPASVRKVRASKTLSLYDDRMMDATDQFACYRDSNSV